MAAATLKLLTDVELLATEELAAGAPADLILPTLPDGRLEGFPADDDQFVVFGYTDVPGLVTACGAGQPSRRVDTAQVLEWVRRAKVDAWFAIDVWHPAGRRYPQPDPLDFEPVPYAEQVSPSVEFWIPTRPVRPGAAVIQAELFAVTPGAPMLLAYESAEELQACCGPHQDAVSIDPADLESVVVSTGAHGVLFGAVLTDDARHQAPVLDWTAHDLFDPDTDPTGRT